MIFIILGLIGIGLSLLGIIYLKTRKTHSIGFQFSTKIRQVGEGVQFSFLPGFYLIRANGLAGIADIGKQYIFVVGIWCFFVALHITPKRDIVREVLEKIHASIQQNKKASTPKKAVAKKATVQKKTVAKVVPKKK